jgi:hypothetical protein
MNIRSETKGPGSFTPRPRVNEFLHRPGFMKFHIETRDL